MSAERTAPHDQPDESPEKPARTGLSGVQMATSALASASTAVVMSFFGVAGTVIGAALASIITTMTAALYGASLRRTSERLQRLRSHGPRPAPAASGTPAAREAAPPSASLPGRLDPRRPPARRGPRWSRVAIGAAAVFGLAMVLVTSIELIGQRPVSALVGASSVRDTTTVGELAGGGTTASTTPAGPSGSSPAPSSATSAPTGTETAGSTAPTTTTRRPTTTSSEPTARSSAPRSTDGGAGVPVPGAPTAVPTGAP